LRSGHVSKENVTLTFGVDAELRVDGEAELEMLGAAVDGTEIRDQGAEIR
jgi:hypothetical protein